VHFCRIGAIQIVDKQWTPVLITYSEVINCTIKRNILVTVKRKGMHHSQLNFESYTKDMGSAINISVFLTQLSHPYPHPASPEVQQGKPQSHECEVEAH
jgi:hypothetical protein